MYRYISVYCIENAAKIYFVNVERKVTATGACDDIILFSEAFPATLKARFSGKGKCADLGLPEDNSHIICISYENFLNAIKQKGTDFSLTIIDWIKMKRIGLHSKNVG